MKLMREIAHERELREQSVAAIDKALILQATEYERRLNTLNHAHEQAVEAQARTVPREMFEQYVKEAREREETLSAAQSATFRAALLGLEAKIDRLDDAEIRRSETERLRLINEAEDKRESERRQSRQQWQIGIATGFVVLVLNWAIRQLAGG